MHRSRCFTFSILVALTGVAAGQTVWSIEGTTPSYGEYNAPPPCGLAPPYTILFPPLAACPVNLPFPNLLCRIGGNDVDNNGNPLSGGPAFPVIVNCDGLTLEMVTDAGVYVTSGPIAGLLPGPFVSGVAQDSALDITYLTDGTSVVGVFPPPGPAGCAPPPIAVAAFPLALPPGVPPACGLGYAPCSGTLWTCDFTGFIGNYAIGGAFLGGFSTAVITPPLTGITVNTTNGNLQITNGTMVAEVTTAGALAAPGAFYLSANPYPIPLWAGGADGLGFSLRPLKYGRGCPPPAPPSIGSAGGYPYAGNAGFTVFETGATPGKTAFLVVSFGFSCPQIPFGGCGPGFAVSLPWFTLLPLGGIPASGTKSVTLPIPAASPAPCGLPVGVPLFLQFVNAGPIEMSDGLAFTIGAL